MIVITNRFLTLYNKSGIYIMAIVYTCLHLLYLMRTRGEEIYHLSARFERSFIIKYSVKSTLKDDI